MQHDKGFGEAGAVAFYFWPFCALRNLLYSSIHPNCRTWPSLILTSFLPVREHCLICLAVFLRIITKSCEPWRSTVLSMSEASLLLHRCLWEKCILTKADWVENELLVHVPLTLQMVGLTLCQILAICMLSTVG
jgi:hypothetical protein